MTEVKLNKNGDRRGYPTRKEKSCQCCGKKFLAMPRSKYCSRKCGEWGKYQGKRGEPIFRIKQLLFMSRNRSKAKGIDFNLDLEYLQSLWEEGGGRCSLTGIAFDLRDANKGKVNPYAPSLDKIEPSLGYVKGNVRIVCYQINVAMSEWGISQFDDLVNHYLVFKESRSVK